MKKKKTVDEKCKFEVSLCLVFSCAVFMLVCWFSPSSSSSFVRLLFIMMEMSAITRQRRMINGEGMLWEEVCHEYWTHRKSILHHYINILNQLKVLFFFFVPFIVRYFLASYLSLFTFLLRCRQVQVDTLTAHPIFIFIVNKQYWIVDEKKYSR